MAINTESCSDLDLFWGLHWEERCCPPSNILITDQPDEELTAHLKICKTCEAERSSGTEAGGLEELAKVLRGYTMPDDVPNAIRPGQVWSVAQSRGGWGPKKRYYNPPDVLVIDTPGTGITVAQICTATYFKQKNDVLLGENFAGYAEPWNIYTLTLEDLEDFLGEVKPDVVSRVLDERSTLREEQKENLVPLELFRRDGMMYFFKHLEIEVGYFFSAPSVFRLVNGKDSEKKNKLIFEGVPKNLQSLEWLISEKLGDKEEGILLFAADGYQYADALAAAGPVEFSADLNYQDERMGTITLELDDTGGGRLIGEFVSPDDCENTVMVTLRSSDSVLLRLTEKGGDLVEAGYGIMVSNDEFKEVSVDLDGEKHAKIALTAFFMKNPK